MLATSGQLDAGCSDRRCVRRVGHANAACPALRTDRCWSTRKLYAGWMTSVHTVASRRPGRASALLLDDVRGDEGHLQRRPDVRVVEARTEQPFGPGETFVEDGARQVQARRRV